LSWEVRLASKAQRDLHAIHGKDLALIHGKILILELDPRSFGAIPLKGSPFFRARAGDWRLIYEINDAGRVIRILRIIRRSERTYRGF
jgi:mRNA-degrading endonuclease RelE of RelBE toxin-antitoxin system